MQPMAKTNLDSTGQKKDPTGKLFDKRRRAKAFVEKTAASFQTWEMGDGSLVRKSSSVLIEMRSSQGGNTRAYEVDR